MKSQYSKSNIERTLLTLKDISRTLDELITWNNDIPNFEAYHTSQSGSNYSPQIAL